MTSWVGLAWGHAADCESSDLMDLLHSGAPPRYSCKWLDGWLDGWMFASGRLLRIPTYLSMHAYTKDNMCLGGDM